MADIRIITASAGSGKTYRLAEVLFEAIKSGQARPEAVVATTFTRKAAAELQERVRVRLIQGHLVEEAQRLAAACIGTVNSVCSSLVSDFSFELGLFADIAVLEEQQADIHLRRSLAEVVDESKQRELASLANRFGEWDWAEVVKEIAQQARNNGLQPSDLRTCKELSVKGLISYLPQTLSEDKALLGQLRAALGRFLEGVNTEHDATKVTGTALQTAQATLNRLNREGQLSWPDWQRLISLKAGKKSNDLLDGVRQAASSHEALPSFQQDLRRGIELVFDLAGGAIQSYQEIKRQWGVMDFADQEVLALKLLGMSEVHERLRGELDLLLVDEFQDTSPLQLAILLKLADCCGKGIWVGDQKQSIFAFRGTDPALMDACMQVMAEKGQQEVLGKSWRSRPQLVNLTSAIFARAFAAHGLAEELVKLEPAHEETQDLGPVLERWAWNATNKVEDVAALASGVEELLNDKTVQVRDRGSQSLRRVRMGDIGILCRTNDMCFSVAEALEARGIKAELARLGLMATPEARLILAGLRLWVDHRDTLAAAELARLLYFSDQPDQWLATLLQDGAAAFSRLPEAAGICQVSSTQPTAGPVSCLDSVMLAVGAHERCLSWGNVESRLGNLEALRAQAIRYLDQSANEGNGATPAGLVSYLQDSATGELDYQGANPGRDAVTVITWHRAKGLEWPVTILFQLQKVFPANSFGIKVISRPEGFDMANPLAGRWIRYWPYPYGRLTSGVALRDRIGASPEATIFEDRERRQNLRLLYVGWTRARDRLVLAGRKGVLAEGILSLLQDEGKPLISEPKDGSVEWAGVKVDCAVRELATEDPVARQLGQVDDVVPAGGREYPPAYISPSKLQGAGQIEQVIQLGAGVSLNGKPDMTQLGIAVHAFMAADRLEYSTEAREALAQEILERWGVGSALVSEELVISSTALQNWLGNSWPLGKLHREWPVMEVMQEGSVLSGIADLVIDCPNGFVIVDYKSTEMDLDKPPEGIGNYAAQMWSYANVLRKATDKGCLGCYVYMYLNGICVKLSMPQSINCH